MSRIRSKDTKQEIKLRKALWNKGFRYRLKSSLPGKPDIVFPSRKAVIFIDGCFWHMCPKCYVAPKSNKKYWLPKLKKNVERDKKNKKLLRKMGWKVMRVWEHEVKKDMEKTLRKLTAFLKQG